MCQKWRKDASRSKARKFWNQPQADILQANTVQTLEANLHFLNILDDPIKKFCVNNKLANFTPHLRSDSLQCFLMMNMLVNLRFVV